MVLDTLLSWESFSPKHLSVRFPRDTRKLSAKFDEDSRSTLSFPAEKGAEVRPKLIVCGSSALEYWRSLGGAKALTSREADELPRPSGRACDVIHGLSCDFLATHRLHAPLEVVAFSREERRSSSAARFRLFKSRLSESDLADAGDGVSVCKPQLAILQVAYELTVAEFALLMCEFCGTYLLSPGDERGFVSTSNPLVNMEGIAEVLSRRPMQVRCCQKKQMTAFSAATPGSNSPMESKIAVFFSFPREEGGLAVPGIQLNKNIELSDIARGILGIGSIRPDFYFPGASTAGEYKSRQFHPEGTWTFDDRRVDALEACGLHTFTLNNERVKSLAELTGIGQVLMRRMGEAFLRPTRQELEKRSRLHAELFLRMT